MPNPETTTLLADLPANAAPGTAASCDQGPQVKVDVEGLITGKNLRCPIFDKSGLLLLAEGSLVTGRFKQLLLARGIRQVMLSQADAEAMSVVAQIAEHARGSDRLDVDLARRLDELIESGRLFIADSGSKFKERLVSYGNKGYNVEQCQKLVEQHVETCGTLDAMIRSAAHGSIPGGTEIAAVVADYLTHLTFDSGCIHEIRFLTTRFAAVGHGDRNRIGNVGRRHSQRRPGGPLARSGNVARSQRNRQRHSRIDTDRVRRDSETSDPHSQSAATGAWDSSACPTDLLSGP
jgi:hypothetical protein